MNLEQIYECSKKKIENLFYGDLKRPKNPYKNCKNNKEIFHLSRKLNI